MYIYIYIYIHVLYLCVFICIYAGPTLKSLDDAVSEASYSGNIEALYSGNIEALKSNHYNTSLVSSILTLNLLFFTLFFLV
jgi:hypothetical protein